MCPLKCCIECRDEGVIIVTDAVPGAILLTIRHPTALTEGVNIALVSAIVSNGMMSTVNETTRSAELAGTVMAHTDRTEVVAALEVPVHHHLVDQVLHPGYS